MATDFTGYTPRGNTLFGWDRETVTIKRPAATGRAFTSVATNVRCKADGETQGLRITAAGAFPAYERKFFFAYTYCKTVAGARATLTMTDYLQTNDTIVDADSVEWHVESVANPGGADEHLEVLGHRAPVE